MEITLFRGDYMRIPKHIGIIPDGNRRWSVKNGLSKENGYENGLEPGLKLYRLCKELGVDEITYYGFTTDNTRRPKEQTEAFSKATVDAVNMLLNEDAELLVIGNANSPMFPEELKPYTNRTNIGRGGIKVNFLVNYGWYWDLLDLASAKDLNKNNIYNHIQSRDVSRIDLIIRWGGRRRLSGFLPVQSIYSDFYVLDDYWPDFNEEHIFEALKWHNQQDVTLGG